MSAPELQTVVAKLCSARDTLTAAAGDRENAAAIAEVVADALQVQIDAIDAIVARAEGEREA